MKPHREVVEQWKQPDDCGYNEQPAIMPEEQQLIIEGQSIKLLVVKDLHEVCKACIGQKQCNDCCCSISCYFSHFIPLSWSCPSAVTGIRQNAKRQIVLTCLYAYRSLNKNAGLPAFHLLHSHSVFSAYWYHKGNSILPVDGLLTCKQLFKLPLIP